MIGQGLLESGWLEPVPNTRDGGGVFKDEYVLYQPGVVRSHCVIAKNIHTYLKEGSQKSRLRQRINLQDTGKSKYFGKTSSIIIVLSFTRHFCFHI